MNKKYFKLTDFVVGAALGIILASLFYSWALGWGLEKLILTSDQLNFANNTSEILLIINDYNDEKVMNDYTVELLNRRIEALKQSKKTTYNILSRGKSDSKYANYSAAIDQIVNSLESVKVKVAKDEGIDTKKDMNEFIDAVENYTKALQELL